MKNVKRSIAIIMAVLMLATAMPMSIFATGDLEGCEHQFTECIRDKKYIVNDGDCKTRAVYYKSCKLCGAPSNDESNIFLGDLDPSNHRGPIEINSKQATCLEAGYSGDRVCSACGVTVESGTTIPQLSHSYTGEYYFDETQKTHKKLCVNGCNLPGGTEGVCTFTSVVTTEPTCISKGVKTYTCSVCNGTYTEEIDEIPHNYTAEIVHERYFAEEANCMSAAKYYKSCATEGCGQSSGLEEDETKRVTFADPNGAVDPENHSKTANELDWTYEYENGTDCTKGGKKYKKCECGVKLDGTEVTFTTHVFERHEKNAPTCTKDGNEFGYTCENCTYKMGYETIPATGHKSVVDPSVPATCTAEGKTAGAHCEKCQRILIEQTTIPALDHDWVISYYTDATCTEDGHEDGKICSRCKQIDYKIIPKLNHKNMKTHQAVSANCLEAGTYEYMSCPDCNKLFMYEKDENGECVLDDQGDEILKEITEAETIEPAKDHDWVYEGEEYAPEYETGKIPDCITGGKGLITCRRCQYKEDREVEPLGHKWAEKGDYYPATCEKDGYTEYKCERDGCEATKEVSNASDKAKGHKWDDKYTIDAVATCYSQGEKSIHCTREGCESKKFPEVIAKEPHNLRERTVPATCTAEGETYQKCGNENCTYETTHVAIPMIGHNYEYLSGSRATCENDSSYIEQCVVCGKVNKDLTKKFGHVDNNKDGYCDNGCGKVMCSCLCHRTDTFGKIMYKIALFFWDLLGIKQTCNCGVVHYTPTHM